MARGARLPHRRRAGRRVHPALRRDPHVGADRRACRTATTTAPPRATSRARCTSTTRRGARSRCASTRTTRGWATPTCCSCAARVTSTDGTPLPDAVIDIWQTGPNGGYDIWDERQPEYNFRGRWKVESEDGAYEFQTMLPKPYTVPTDGPVGRYLEAVGQHPWRPAHIHFKVDAPGHAAARHPGVLPRRPVPGERHHRRGQVGARAPRPARGRPPGLPVRHRAAAGGLSRFASCALGERRFAALVEGEVVRPLFGVSELGASTPAEVLADPPLSGEAVRARRRDAAARSSRARARSCASGSTTRPTSTRASSRCRTTRRCSRSTPTRWSARGSPCSIPPESEAVDYEAELAFVVGRRGAAGAGATTRSPRSAATRSPTTSRCATTSTRRTSGCRARRGRPRRRSARTW